MTDRLKHLTFRELLAARRLAQRAVSRGRNPARAQALAAAIEGELAERKDRIWARRSADAPDLTGRKPD